MTTSKRVRKASSKKAQAGAVLRLQNGRRRAEIPLALHVRTLHQIWHPYAQLPSDGITHICRLVAIDDEDGDDRYFDGLVSAGFKQAEELEDVGYDVAKVTIREVVGNVHAPTGWFASFDQIDSHICELGEWLEDIETRIELGSPAPSQMSGSGAVFYVEELCVHPAAQGSHLGLHLVGQALTYLKRSTSDIAVFKPIAIPNELDPSIDYEEVADNFTAPRVTPSLIPYYEQLGFKVDEAWKKETGDTLMFAEIGWSRMPAEYWPSA